MRSVILSICLSVFSMMPGFSQPGREIDSLLIELAKVKNDNAIAAEISNKIGISYFYLGEFQDAIQYVEKALTIREALGDKKEIANSLHALGNIYTRMARHEDAQMLCRKALLLREEIQDTNGIISSYNTLGVISKNNGNFTTAIEYYLKALRMAEQIQDRKRSAFMYHNIGVIYQRLSQFEEAIKYYKLSLKIDEEFDYKNGIADSYNSIGSCYGQQMKYEEALPCLLKALHLQKEMGSKTAVAQISSNIGLVLLNLQRNAEAKEYLEAALLVSEETGDQATMAQCYSHLGHLSIDLGLYAEARKYFIHNLELSKEMQDKHKIREAYNNLIRLDTIQGDHAQALYHYRYSSLYKDSLFNEENQKTLSELQIKFETERKDKEINILKNQKQIDHLELKLRGESIKRMNSENQFQQQQLALITKDKELQDLAYKQTQDQLRIKQDSLTLLNQKSEIQKIQLEKQATTRNYLLAVLGLVLLVSFISYRSYATSQRLKLQTLRNKIASDLHDDVGSTLSSISIFSQMALQQSKEVQPLLTTIGESSRKMLDAMADIVWTIHPENDQFEKIIMRMRSFAFELLGAKSISFQFVADPDIAKINLPMDVRRNLYLIFKEATNNLVKYSAADKALFTLKSEKENLTMTIHDNGKGFDTSMATEGNGLKNMHRRAKEIGAHLRIESVKGNGTTVELRVAV